MAQKQEITKVHTRQGKHKTGIVTLKLLDKWTNIMCLVKH